jgi:hypothetical protein
VVQYFPTAIADVPENVLPDPAQRTAGLIGAKLCGRLDYDDADP